MRIDFGASVTWEAMTSTATAFWSWWTAELRELIPEGAAVHLDRFVQRWSVTTDGEVWRLRRKGASDTGILLDTREPPMAVREQVERLEPNALAARVETELAPSDVLVRRMRFPVSAGAHLRSVVRLQLDRLSPFPADDVRFDCRKVGEIDGDIEVEVAIVPRAALDGHQAKLAAFGLNTDIFRLGEFSFRPRPRAWGRHQMAQAALAAAALVLWIGIFFIAPVMRERELDALGDDVARLRGPARQALAARDEIDRLATQADAVTSALAKPDLLETLRTLTGAIPDDTHLTELTLDAGRAGFIAMGPNTSHIVAALRHADGIGRSRITAMPEGPGGAFAVEADLRTSAGEGRP